MNLKKYGRPILDGIDANRSSLGLVESARRDPQIESEHYPPIITTEAVRKTNARNIFSTTRLSVVETQGFDEQCKIISSTSVPTMHFRI